MENIETRLAAASNGRVEVEFGNVYGVTWIVGVLAVWWFHDEFPGPGERLAALVRDLLTALGVTHMPFVDGVGTVAVGAAVLLAGCALGAILAALVTLGIHIWSDAAARPKAR